MGDIAMHMFEIEKQRFFCRTISIFAYPIATQNRTLTFLIPRCCSLGNKNASIFNNNDSNNWLTIQREINDFVILFE